MHVEGSDQNLCMRRIRLSLQSTRCPQICLEIYWTGCECVGQCFFRLLVYVLKAILQFAPVVSMYAAQPLRMPVLHYSVPALVCVAMVSGRRSESAPVFPQPCADDRY